MGRTGATVNSCGQDVKKSGFVVQIVVYIMVINVEVNSSIIQYIGFIIVLLDLVSKLQAAMSRPG